MANKPNSFKKLSVSFKTPSIDSAPDIVIGRTKIVESLWRRVESGSMRLLSERLARLGHKDDVLFYLEDMLRRVPHTHWARALIVSRLLDKFIQDEDRLRQMVLLYKDDTDSLISGLISWIQNQMPLTRSDAEKLEDADKMLQSLFAGVPDAAPALQLLQAARRDASGDRKALLDLPIEMRRLVKTDSTKDEI